MLWIPQQHSQTPPPLWLPWGGGWGGGLVPVEAIVQFLTGRRRNRAVLFQLWLCDSCMSTRIVRGYELFLMAETPLNGFVQRPEGRGLKKTTKTKTKIHWKWTTWRKGRKAGFCFFLARQHMTCHTALNLLFYLKLLHLAPNLCWRYTMSYPYSFDAHRNDKTQAKIP